MFRCALVFAIAGMTLPSFSFGQDWFGPIMPQPTFDAQAEIMGQNMMNEIIGQTAIDEAKEGERRAPNAARPAVRPSHRTSYPVSASSHRLVAAEFTRRLRAKNLVAASQTEAQMRQHDFGQVYTNIVAPFGLRRGDTADAFTAYTLLSWMIANGRTDPTREQVAAARRNAAAVVSTNPALASEAARAKLGEEVTILFVLLHAGWQSAQKEGKLQAYSDGVAAIFKKQFGRDLRRLELTDTGFRDRG